MTYKFDKTVIVGGGSSGWIVASIMSRYFPNKDITLIESPNIPTIGVGESTTAMMKHFITGHLGIPEYEFLKGVDGIYKMSVKFNDFYYENDGGFHYPFGFPHDDQLQPFGIESWHLVKYFYPDIPRTDFVRSLFSAAALFEKNKFSDNESLMFDNYNPKIDRGYHLDANKLGTFLKDKYCIPRGVKHILANIRSANINDDGIKSVILDDGSEIEGDFFIDCSGFKSLLLGQHMKPKFVDLSHKLPNNKAWATPIQYKDVYKEMIPYTNSTALKNGWAWYTPIWSRIGNGYAYCDKYISSEDALEEFKSYILSDKIPAKLTKEEVESLPFFELNMKAGYHEESWVKNVLAIGLSSGFLEPLEGTGLLFIHDVMFDAVNILMRDRFTQTNIDQFNMITAERYCLWGDALSLFYAYSVRDDSEYWKDISKKSFEKEVISPKSFYSYAGIKDMLFRNGRDHGSISGRISPGLSLNDVVSVGYDMTMDINEQIMDRWNLWESDKVNYKATAQKFKEIFDYNKERWASAALNEKHIYDYLKENVYYEK